MHLLDLPNELLHAIREHIGPRDLLAHVAFLLTCPRTSACYAMTATPPGFWRKLLRASGLGLSTVEKDTERRCKRIGVECAKHAWACPDPACGMARFEGNRALVHKAEQGWPNWDIEKAVAPQEVQEHAKGEIKTNGIFARLSFNNRFPVTAFSDARRGRHIQECAFIRQAAPGWSSTDLIKHHPIARRSFATFPALTTMCILNLADNPSYPYGLDIANPAGVTVHDYLIAVSEILGERMSCDLLWDWLQYVRGVPDDQDEIFPDSWAYCDVLLAASKVGSWFQLTNCDGITAEGASDDVPSFMIWFS